MKKLLYILLITVAASCSPKLSPDNNWGYQRWVLIEMKDVPVQQSGGSRDAYVEFYPPEKRISGNGGCNRISGTYTIEKKDRIKFSEVISSKMACPDISFENAFLETLSKIDRFETVDNTIRLKDDNKTLLVLQRREQTR